MASSLQSAKPYKTYGLLRKISGVGFVISLLALGVLTFFGAMWGVGIEDTQSGAGWLPAIFCALLFVLLIWFLAGILSNDGGEALAVFHYGVGVASLIWWTAYLGHSLIAGDTYRVPANEIRMGIAGQMYEEHEVAPRGFMSLKTVKLPQKFLFEISFEENSLLPTDNKVVEGKTVLELQFSANDLSALRAKSEELISSGTALKDLFDVLEKEVEMEAERLEASLPKQPARELQVGEILPTSLPWIKEAQVVSRTVTSSFAD